MKAPIILEIIIWVSSIIRIVICFLPQNNWCSDEGNLGCLIVEFDMIVRRAVGK